MRHDDSRLRRLRAGARSRDMTADGAYVYALVVDGVERYIGKGSGVPLKRAKEHLLRARRLLRRRAAGEAAQGTRLQNKLAKALSDGSAIREVVIADALSHEEAFRREISEIAARPEGQLWNLDSGGLGAGRVGTETRLKQSAIGKARALDPEERAELKRRSSLAHTPAFRERSRQRLIEKSRDPEYVDQLRAQQRQKWSDPEIAARMAAGLEKGRRTPSPDRAAGKWAYPGAREHHSEAMKRRWADPEFRSRQAARRSGKGLS
jgi:hypothetical protein